MNGPAAKSTADLANTRRDGSSLDVGSGVIICEQGFDFRRRHTAHSFSHARISSRPESNRIEWIMLRVSGWSRRQGYLVHGIPLR